MMQYRANLQSYVTLKLWGRSPEKVINMAISRGIPIWSVKDKGNLHWELKTNVNGVRPLFRLARRGGCNLKITEKSGPVFLLGRIKRRKSLAVGCLIFCLGLFFFSRFIWLVEVKCSTPLLELKTLEIMGEYGLTRFSLRSAVDIDHVRDKMALRIPDATWIGVEMQGGRLMVEVVEKKQQVDPRLYGDGDLFASEDGVIQEILVLQGMPMVQVGDIVKKGQILIAGYQLMTEDEMRIRQKNAQRQADKVAQQGEEARRLWEEEEKLANQGIKKIQARGLIRAKVQRHLEGQCPLKEEILKDTGQQSTWYRLQVKGKTLRLNGVPQPPYELFRIVTNVKTLWQGRNQDEVVEFTTVIYKEQVKSIKKRTAQQAVAEGERRALEELRKKTPEDCRILQQEALPIEPEVNGSVRIALQVETLEDIGCLQEVK